MAPSVNSYKRLVPGYEAPVYIGWAEVNRSALIRIPRVNHGNNNGVRIELRCPDPSANPYLAFNAMLAAGLDGIKNHLQPSVEIDEDLSEDKKKHLPTTLEDAVKAFRKDVFVQTVLGTHISEKYLEAKQAEWNAYCEQVTKWEVDMYLNRI